MTFKMVALTSMLFAGSLCVWAADGRIVGRLTDPQGAVVAGATLRLAASSGALWVEASTDKDGRFVFTAVPPGDYEMRASAAGFDEIKETMHVGDGEALRVDLQFAHLAARVETVRVAADVSRDPTADRRSFLDVPTITLPFASQGRI